MARGPYTKYRATGHRDMEIGMRKKKIQKGNPVAKSLRSQHLRKQVVPSKKAYDRNRNKVNKENTHDQDQDI